MGTWGIRLYEDDTALDVRDAYLDSLGNGLSGPDATRRLLAGDYGFYTREREWLYQPVPWLALADTQWRVGRLEDEVKAQALAAIENGWDLEGWQEAPERDRRRRRIVLTWLRRRLLSPQPSLKRIPRRYVQEPGFAVGDVVRYRLRSGRFVLFKVVEHHAWPNDDVTAILELLDRIGDGTPSVEAIVPLEHRPKSGTGAFIFSPRVDMRRATKRDFPVGRLRVLAHGLPVSPRRPRDGEQDLRWRDLDDALSESYGLS